MSMQDEMKIKADNTKTLIEELAAITPQRPLADVAKECDIVFSDGMAPIKLKSFVVTDPFKSALDFSRDKKKVCLAVFGKYFLVVYPDARWMRALRLYQSRKIGRDAECRMR